MSNDEPTFFVKVRGFIGHIAWLVFLWSIQMTDETYDYAVHIGCVPDNGARYCEHGYNGICKTCDAMTPPMKYWQHGETGRVCATASQPSEGWDEIAKESYYEIFFGAMKNMEPIDNA